MNSLNCEVRRRELNTNRIKQFLQEATEAAKAKTSAEHGAYLRPLVVRNQPLVVWPGTRNSSSIVVV